MTKSRPPKRRRNAAALAPGKPFVPRPYSSRPQFVQTAVPQAPVVAALAPFIGTFFASALVYGTLSVPTSLTASVLP